MRNFVESSERSYVPTRAGVLIRVVSAANVVSALALCNVVSGRELYVVSRTSTVVSGLVDAALYDAG